MNLGKSFSAFPPTTHILESNALSVLIFMAFLNKSHS